MAYQNINQYNFRRWGIKPVNEITDICLASDERDYDQEVVFSPLLIGELDGLLIIKQLFQKIIGTLMMLTQTFVQSSQNYVMLV